jgi:2,3-bisphosphoglycerate-dependent phosphoglycerate mutase
VTILLVRHAQPVAPGSAGHEENARPLSAAGHDQAERLADDLAGAGVSAVYSSPYPRAVQTLAPLARRLRLEIVIVDDLRERLLSPRPLPGWRAALRRSWADFSLRLPGGESSAETQRRIQRVLADLEQRHPAARPPSPATAT